MPDADTAEAGSYTLTPGTEICAFHGFAEALPAPIVAGKRLSEVSIIPITGQ